MIEAYLRPAYQKCLVDPVAAKISAYCNANQITYLAGITGILVAPALFLGWVAAGIFLLLLSGYADTLDGTLARIQANSSEFGSILDIVTDRMVEFAIIIGLYALDPGHRGFFCLAMLGSILICVSSFLVVGIFSTNDSHKGFYYSPGLIERPEAFLFFLLMLLIPAYFSLLAVIFISLVLWTSFWRIKQFYVKSTCKATY